MSAEPSLRERIAGLRLLEDPEARAEGLLVCFSDRHGGVSSSPYDSLNLAATVGDAPEAVAHNRARVASEAGFDLADLALTRQVHGSSIHEVEREAAGVLGEADGLVVREGGSIGGILTADCAPVVVQGGDGLALLHAGWRGLVAGVIERGVDKLQGASRAWVGPSIRSCCYSVGPEVVAAFVQAGLPAAASDRVDPADAAAFALRRAGIRSVAVAGECTSCDARYFSFRRERLTGRQGAFAGYLER